LCENDDVFAGVGEVPLTLLLRSPQLTRSGGDTLYLSILLLRSSSYFLLLLRRLILSISISIFSQFSCRDSVSERHCEAAAGIA
jgi:hypothetical protein